MSYAGKWGWCDGGDYCHGCYETREEAIQAAIEGMEETESLEIGQTFQVILYRDPEPPEKYFDVESFFDHLMDQDDYLGEYTDQWFDSLKPHHGELEQAIRGVIAEWLKKHSLHPSFGLADEIEELTYRGPATTEETAK